MKPTKKAAIVAFLITAAVVALSIVSAASAVWGS
jgi:predicted benzoate:H+ symporter BenE